MARKTADVVDTPWRLKTLSATRDAPGATRRCAAGGARPAPRRDPAPRGRARQGAGGGGRSGALDEAVRDDLGDPGAIGEPGYRRGGHARGIGRQEVVAGDASGASQDRL